MRKIVLLSVMMLVAVILSTGCMSPGRSKTEKETITLKDTDLISIEASSADIEVISEDREDISVVLNTYERGPKLKVSGGKTVHIAAESQRGIHVGVTFSYSPRMTIYVPKEYNKSIEVDNSSGDLVMKELNLDGLQIDLSSGDIRVTKVTFKEGDIDSSSGDITLKGVVCDQIKIDSSSGDLRLEDFTGAIEGSSSSGDVLITYKEYSGDIDYSTQSGDITVDFNNQQVDADFDLDCNSGDIDINFDLDEISKDKKNYISGTNGEGTYQVRIHASSGDITVKK